MGIPPEEPRKEGAGLTYSESGVDIEKANLAKRRIRELARSTFGPSVLSEIGSFAGVFRPDITGLERPVLLASADGVGTKLKIAFMAGIHDTVGIDIVAHCTNDILVQGALPIFFLDYIATGKLEPGVVEQIVTGLAKGCRTSGCALLGGETAEMPDFYAPGEYDLAGFIVGIADQSALLLPGRVRRQDVLVGLPSSGLHTNGYSLVRRLFFAQERLDLSDHLPELGRTVGEELLEPHRNYLPSVRALLARDLLNGMAHITGGGITENLDRVLGPSLDAHVERGSWDVLPVFRFIQDRGRVEAGEMFRTFNMGIGLVLVVAPDRLADVEEHFRQRGERHFLIGEVTDGTGKVVYR